MRPYRQIFATLRRLTALLAPGPGTLATLALLVVLVSAILLVLQGIVLAYRLPPGRTLRALAAGRLGGPVARIAAPIAMRLPEETVAVELAA